MCYKIGGKITMQSVNNQIEIEITNGQKGKIIFAEDFKKFGSSEVVRITLFRLCKKGLIALGLSTQVPMFCNEFWQKT